MEVEEKAIDNGSDLPSSSDRPAEDSSKENNAAVSVDLHAQLSVSDLITAPATSDVQALGDASAGWKMVLHEESNHYYYWNTVTGETSWEVPQILGHAAESRLEEKVAAETECIGSATSENLESSAKMDMDTRQAGVSYSDINECRQPINENLHDKKRYNEEDQSGKINCSEQIDSLHNEISSPGGSLSSGQSDHVPTGHLSGSGEDFTKCRDADYVTEDETEADFSSDLVKHCERLLEQLETMKGYATEFVFALLLGSLFLALFVFLVARRKSFQEDLFISPFPSLVYFYCFISCSTGLNFTFSMIKFQNMCWNLRLG